MYGLIFVAFIGYLVGFFNGLSFHKIQKALDSVKNTIRKETKPSIVSTSSEVARIRQREESPFIAEPKTPQQINFEESEELRRLNPGRFT